MKRPILTAIFVLCVSAIHAGESRYVTTPQDVVVAMLDAVNVSAADTVVDLGCGDGRIPIIAAAKYGVMAVGVEYDPQIVAVAQKNVERNGLGSLVRIHHGDVLRMRWNTKQKVVTVYLDQELLRKLRPVLEKLPPGSRVVSHQHSIPGWTSTGPIELHEHRFYRYRVTQATRKQKVCGPQGCTYKDVTYTVVKGY